MGGGHRRTVAFLFPGLRSSAPPDITVVITALPPGKLFTGSYGSCVKKIKKKKKKFNDDNKEEKVDEGK